MAYPVTVLQWEIYMAELDPHVGREQGADSRPVIVVSNDGFNKVFDVVTVLPLSKAADKRRKVYPFEVLLPAAEAGNAVESIIMPQQMRTISKTRFLSRLGRLNNINLRRQVEDRILDHLGISLDIEE